MLFRSSNFFILKKLVQIFIKSNLSFDTLDLLLDIDNISNIENLDFKKRISILYFYIKINYKSRSNQDRKDIEQLGGLFVIGSERHESRRIDNQLRGRAGRQGDSGSSRFYISLEDKIFRIFGGNNIQNLIQTFQLNLNNDETPLESNLLTQSLDLAQEKVENYFYEMRKRVYEYDEVLNEQRRVFYSTRSFILKTPTIRNWILDLGEYLILDIVNYISTINFQKNQINHNDLIELKKLLGFSLDLNLESLQKISPALFFNFLREQFWLIYDLKEINSELIDPGFYRQFEKICLLQAIDFSWSEHLQKMNDLRESIGWRAYAQRDPLIEYKQEGYRIFTNTLKQIRNFSIYAILSID